MMEGEGIGYLFLFISGIFCGVMVAYVWASVRAEQQCKDAEVQEIARLRSIVAAQAEDLDKHRIDADQGFVGQRMAGMRLCCRLSCQKTQLHPPLTRIEEEMK